MASRPHKAASRRDTSSDQHSWADSLSTSAAKEFESDWTRSWQLAAAACGAVLRECVYVWGFPADTSVTFDPPLIKQNLTRPSLDPPVERLFGHQFSCPRAPSHTTSRAHWPQ